MKNKDLINLLAKNLKRIRQRQKISQEELSFRCELNRNYLSDIERGNRNPSLKIIEKIANGLKVNVIELFKK